MHHVACVHYKYRNLCKEGLETGPVLLSSHCPLDIAGQHAPTLRLLVLQLKEEITANGHNSYYVVLEPVLVHCLYSSPTHQARADILLSHYKRC